MFKNISTKQQKTDKLLISLQSIAIIYKFIMYYFFITNAFPEIISWYF